MTINRYERGGIPTKSQSDYISKKRVQENIRRYLKEVLNRKPNIYNGYKSLDLEKIENIISYIASGQLKKQFLFGKSKF